MPDIYQIIIMILIGICAFLMREKLKNVENILDKLKFNIKAIANSLTKAKDIDFNQSYLKDYSPITITPEGEKYLEDIGFVKIFSEYSSDFFRIIDLEKPAMKYDVELSATKSILALLEKEYFKPIKVYFYNHPKEDIRGFAKIAGIYIRDKYLEKHPEIKQ